MKEMLEHHLSKTPGVIRDALLGVVDLAQKAMQPVIVDVPGMPDDIVAYFLPGNPDLKLLTKPLPAAKQTAGSLETLIALAQSYPKGEVWYDDSRVRLLFDKDGMRHESAVCPLVTTDAWDRLLGLNTTHRNKFDQKGLIRFLRNDMADCTFGDADKLLLAAKKIKFKKVSESEASVDHGRASVGKKLEAEVSGAADIPETISLSMAVYRDEPGTATHFIKCSVEIDTETAEFRLTPLCGQIEKAEADALKNVRIALSQQLPAGYPLYAGSPY